MANPKGPPNSSAPSTAEIVGGAYNATPPVLVDGQASALQLDINGKLITSNSGAGTSNVNITGINGPAPSLTNPLFVELSDGTQATGVPSNPLSVNVITSGTVTTAGVYNTTIPTPAPAGVTQLQQDSAASLYVNTEGRKATYSCFATFTAAAGDIALLPGSASKTIRVLRVEVSLSTSGTSVIEAVQLVKRSAVDTGGTSAAMVAVPHDSAFAAASSAPLSYTVAPTLGTTVGSIRGVQFADSSSAALPGSNTWLWDWGMRPGTAIVLRGVAQQLCVNLGGAVATQTAVVSFEWSEE